MPPQSEAIESPDKAEIEEEREPGWAPSRAVLLLTAEDADHFFCWEGTDITRQIEEVSTDPFELGFMNDNGIYVWEGVFCEDRHGDLVPKGTYRHLTLQEMAYVSRGMSPWGLLDCAPSSETVTRHPLEPLPLLLEGVGHPLELKLETLAALSTTVVKSREGQNREARPFTLEHARACLSGFWSQPNGPAEYLALAGVLLQAYELQMKKK